TGSSSARWSPPCSSPAGTCSEKQSRKCACRNEDRRPPLTSAAASAIRLRYPRRVTQVTSDALAHLARFGNRQQGPDMDHALAHHQLDIDTGRTRATEEKKRIVMGDVARADYQQHRRQGTELTLDGADIGMIHTQLAGIQAPGFTKAGSGQHGVAPFAGGDIAVAQAYIQPGTDQHEAGWQSQPLLAQRVAERECQAASGRVPHH